VYSCCTVPRCPCTVTGRRTTLPYIFLCWPEPIGGDDHQCTVYGDTDDRRGWSNCCYDEIGSGTWFYNSLYADTDARKNKSRPVEADPTGEKTLGTVLCSSRDGVPLKLKKKKADQAVLKYLSIDTTFDPCYLSLDSTFKISQFLIYLCSIGTYGTGTDGTFGTMELLVLTLQKIRIRYQYRTKMPRIHNPGYHYRYHTIPNLLMVPSERWYRRYWCCKRKLESGTGTYLR